MGLNMEEMYRKIVIILIFITFSSCVKGWPPRLHINDVQALSPYAVKLSWTTRRGHASASRDISYTVRYKEKGGTYEYLDVMNSEAEITDLEPDTIYVFSVKSVSEEKEGAWSKHVISATMSEPNKGYMINATLPVPEIVSGQALSSHSIKLVWNIESRISALKSDLTYNVRYLFGNGNIDYIDVNNTEVTLKYLMSNTTYLCSVRSVFEDVTSDWSEQFPVTTMTVFHSEEASNIVTVTEVSSGHVIVTWSEQEMFEGKHFTGYQLTIRQDNEASSRDVVVQNPPYKLSKLEPNSHYIISVYAIFKSGNQKLGTSRFLTSERTVSLPPSPPRKLRTKIIGNKNILVKWKPPENNSVTNYILRYKRRKADPKELCEVLINGRKRKYVIKDVRSDSRYGVQIASFHHRTQGPFTDWVVEKTQPLVTRSSTQSPRFRVFSVAPHEVVILWKSKTSRPEESIYLEVWKEDSYLYQRKMTGRHYFMIRNLTAGDTYMFVLKEFIEFCPRNRIIQLQMPTVPVAAVTDACTKNYDPLLRALPSPYTGVIVTWIPFSECKAFYIIRVFEGDRQDAHTGSFVIEEKVSQKKLDSLKDNQTYIIVLSAFDKYNGHLLYESAQLILRPRDSDEARNDSSQLAVPFSHMDLLLYRPNVSSSLFDTQLNLTTGNSTLTRTFERENAWMYLTLPEEFLSQNITITYERASEEIQVQSKVAVPPIVMNMRDIIAMEGETVQLRCFSSGDPYPELKWKKEERQITAKDFGPVLTIYTRYINSFPKSTNHPLFVRESVLTLQLVRQENSGNYFCVASNKAGSTIGSLRLLVKGRPPKQVRNVRAVSVTPYEVQMDWTSPYDAVHNSTTYKIYLKNDEDQNTKEIYVGTSLLYSLTNLTPDTMFMAEVVAFNEGLQGERGRNIYFRTLPLPKLSIPRNVELKTINSSTIVITWLPPLMVSNKFLYIRKYSVHYRKQNTLLAKEVDLDKDSHAYILSGLEKDAAYDIRVLAMTVDRQVSYSGWLEGYTHREAYLNESVPPPPPFDVYLRAVDGNILITWYASNQTNFLIRGFVINVFLNDTLLQSLVVHHEEKNIVIHDSDPGSSYTIEVRSKNNMGLSDPVAKTIYIPDEDVTAYPVSNFTGYPLSSIALSLEWVRPERGRFSRYILNYGFADSTTSIGSGDLPAYTTNYVVRSLRPYTKYLLTITPYLKGKAGNTSSVIIRTYSDVPDEPPTNISITAIDTTKVHIQCHPPANGSNGEIISYKIVYKAAHERGWYVRQSDQLQRLNWIWDGLYPTVNYDVRIHAMTVNGTGPGSPLYSVSTLKPVTDAPKVPIPPKSMHVVSSNKTFAVAWELASNGTQHLLGFVVGYGKFIPEVYRVILPASARNFTINDIDSNTRYIVSVRSFNVFGESKAIFDLIDT